MKPKFFIFLDIDGVMYDWNYLVGNNIKNGGIIKTYNPESIKALNLLIERLSTCYTPVLVISSTCRRDMLFTVKTLKDNGFIVNLRIYSTPISSTPEKRGLEILSFLKMQKDNQNFVIIDDERFDYKEHFSLDKIIKPNMFTGSLNCDMVDNFLKHIGIVCDKPDDHQK